MLSGQTSFTPLHDLSDTYRYLRSMELSIWEHKASEWYVKIIGRISKTESRPEKLMQMQMFPSYCGSLGNWSMEKRVEGKSWSSFPFTLGKPDFCFLNSPTSIFSENTFIRFLSVSSPASFYIFPPTLHLLSLMLTALLGWDVWVCVGCVKYPSNLYQQTYLPSGLQWLGFTLGASPCIFSLSMHPSLCVKKTDEQHLNHVHTACWIPSKTSKVHYTSILAVSPAVRSWLAIELLLRQTPQPPKGDGGWAIT